jgi:hypothetical protein
MEGNYVRKGRNGRKLPTVVVTPVKEEEEVGCFIRNFQ